MSRVLSIQSHVAFGYVGGKAAVFPLQCLGYDVDVVNTVNFSNHSGYGRFGGPRATASELCGIFQHLDENGLLLAERLLTGYIPGGEAVSAIKDLATKLRQRIPDLVYLLDPVLGDAGKLYVAPDVVPIYQAMLPLSSIITPNWFEVEVLTNTRISDLKSLRRALTILHVDHQVPNVVISSIPLRAWLRDALPVHISPPHTEVDSDTDYLVCICSSLSSTDGKDNNSLSRVYARCIPSLPGYFSGVGDLFSALVLAHFTPPNTTSPCPTTEHSTNPLAYAVTQALTKTHSILALTCEYANALPEDERLPTDEELDKQEPERKIRRMRGRELRLIQGQDIIRGTKAVEVRTMEPWSEFWA